MTLGDIAQSPALPLDLRAGAACWACGPVRHASRLTGRSALLRTGFPRNPVVSAECLRCLTLRLFGYRTSFCYDVTAFAYQTLVDRQVIVSG
jgi:hypothetical protein